MPSRIDIPLTGSAPRSGSAGLDGDVPRNAALAVRMLRYERVPVPDKQTGRPQEGPVMVGGRPLRNPDGSVRTGPVGTITGFYGETLCSHEKVFMRLSTDQEERADGSATGVSPNRHDLNVMVYAATPGIRRGRYGELVDIESLPDREKPVMFCQRVVPLRDPRSGGPVCAEDGSLKCRAGWFTVLGNFKNEAGAEVRQLDHMTAERVSSVSMVLDAKWFAAIRESLRESCAANIQSYGRAASLAARSVMEKFTGEAAKAAEADGSQPSSLGRLSVTAWYPERHIRVLNGEGKEEARRTLEAWLAEPKFQKRLVQGPDGMPAERDSPVSPDMIIRLLNEKGEAAGAIRLDAGFSAKWPLPKRKDRVIQRLLWRGSPRRPDARSGSWTSSARSPSRAEKNSPASTCSQAKAAGSAVRSRSRALSATDMADAASSTRQESFSTGPSCTRTPPFRARSGRKSPAASTLSPATRTTSSPDSTASMTAKPACR